MCAFGVVWSLQSLQFHWRDNLSNDLFCVVQRESLTRSIVTLTVGSLTHMRLYALVTQLSHWEHEVLMICSLVTARIARMYRFCLVCVSVQVPKTDNFITTSHFAFIWGVWTHSGMSVWARVSAWAFLLPPPPGGSGLCELELILV